MAGPSVGRAGLPDHYVDHAAVTPSDATVVNCVAWYVGGAGNVAITSPSGNDATFVAVLVGHVYRIAARQIKSTGTTATNIVALY